MDALGIDTSLFSIHSLRRGGPTAAYRAGIDQLNIKRHGMWASEAFWAYITAPSSMSASPVATALAAAAAIVGTL